MLQSLGGLHRAANSLDSFVALPQLKVVGQRFSGAGVEALCELFVRGMIEVRLQLAPIVELENRRERIVRRHELFEGAADRDARTDARATNRRNLTSGARQRGGECVAHLLGKPWLETKQNHVNDHLGRRLGGCAVRLFVAAGFDGGHAARLPDGALGFDGGRAACLPDGAPGFDDGHAARLPDGALGFDDGHAVRLPDGPVGFDDGHAMRLPDGPVGFDGDQAVRLTDGPVGFDGGRAVRVSDGAAGLDGGRREACSRRPASRLRLFLNTSRGSRWSPPGRQSRSRLMRAR
jgi:hypothetical protein